MLRVAWFVVVLLVPACCESAGTDAGEPACVEAVCAGRVTCCLPDEVRCSDGGCYETFAECRSAGGLQCIDPEPGELVCLGVDGVEPCGPVDRCAWSLCGDIGVCCPADHPIGCAPGTCATSEAVCVAAGGGGCVP